MPTGRIGAPVSSDSRDMPTRPISSRRGLRLTVPSGNTPTLSPAASARLDALGRGRRLLEVGLETIEECGLGRFPRDDDRTRTAHHPPDDRNHQEIPVPKEPDPLSVAVPAQERRDHQRLALDVVIDGDDERLRRKMKIFQAVDGAHLADRQETDRTLDRAIDEIGVRQRTVEHLPRRRNPGPGNRRRRGCRCAPTPRTTAEDCGAAPANT